MVGGKHHGLHLFLCVVNNSVISDHPVPATCPHLPAAGPMSPHSPARSLPREPSPDPVCKEPIETNELPEVPENKKGWIKGAAFELLERHLPHFIELYEESPGQAKEYVDTACNDLHMHFDFRLPMNVPPEKPYDPAELLSKKDQLLRTAVIARDSVGVELAV